MSVPAKVAGPRRLPCFQVILGIALIPFGLFAGRASAEPADEAVAFSDPPVVFERIHHRYRFEADGTGEIALEVEARAQNAAGVQQLGEVVLPYLKTRSSIDIQHLRVRRPDGTVRDFDRSKVQHLPAPVASAFPVYSDLHMLHAPAPLLRPGDLVEYSLRSVLNQPDTPGDFGMGHIFERSMPVTHEVLEIDVPVDAEVHWRSGEGLDPEILEAGDRRIYRWGLSNASAQAAEIDRPDVELSSFSSWDELGAWYSELARGRAAPDRSLRQLAKKLTQDATDDRERLEAIYYYVAREFRYLSLSLGIARYQPQAASDMVSNGYGDCKDKHTLLEALARALGIEAFPVLISSSMEISESVPSLHLFDHAITLVRLGDERIWLDATSQVTPFGYLNPRLRGKQALVVGMDGTSGLQQTPDALPFPATERTRFEGDVSPDGELVASIEYLSRGDREVELRTIFFASPPNLRQQLAERVAQGLMGTGFEIDEFSTSELTDTEKPFELRYRVRNSAYLEPLTERQELDHYLITPLLLPKPDEAEATLELDGPIEALAEFQVRLPAGFQVRAPAGSEMATDFASYRSEYSLDGGTLSARRRVTVVSAELPAKQYRAYDAYRSTLREDDRQRFEVRQSAESLAERSGSASVEELFDAGKRAFQDDDYEAAIARRQQVVETDAEHPEAWHYLGRALVHSERYEEGIAALETQTIVDPYLESSFATLGWALEKVEDLEGAEAAYRKQTEVYPLDPYAYRQLGRMLGNRERCDEALPLLEKASSLGRDDTRSSMYLGNCLLSLGERERARSVLLDVLDASDSGWELGKAGYRASEANEVTLAEKLLRRATELDPEHDSAFNDLGLVYLKLDRPEDAITALERQLKIDPDHPYAHNNLGQALHRAGRIDEAVQSFGRQIEIDPQDPWAHRNLAGALEELGDTERAIESLEQHLENEPWDVDALRDLGRLVWSSMEDSDRLLARVRRALEEEPDNRDLRSLDAVLLARLGRCEEAVPSLEAIVIEEPESLPVLTALTSCYYDHLRVNHKALEYGSRAVSLAPDEPWLNRVLGLIYSQKGEYSSALRHLEAAKRNSADTFDLDDVLEYLNEQVKNKP